MGKITRWLGATIAAEQDRFFYWVPVLLGAGIALYFWLPDEPPLVPCLLAGLGGVAINRLWRQGLAGLVVGGGLASLAVGFTVGKVASVIAAAPVLERELRSAVVTGWVELVEPRAAGGERIVVRVWAIAGLGTEATPSRVRIRIPAGKPAFRPGDAIRIAAHLLPPPGPALPGAYDFARTAWFLRLGAVGSSRVRPERAEPGVAMPLALRLWMPVEQVRQAISRRVNVALPGETGAIAAALITGERGGITEATNQIYRDSGIFHILSISGLHMTIFAGALYVACRFLLSLVPILALQLEIKKWSAWAGLIGTGGYLLISGGSPPAVRSALMLSVMFVAVLLDRPALALRNVALAALVILAATPAAVIDVGFQMSFAAVIALISGVEAWQSWRRSRATAERRGGGRRGGAASFLGAIALTTLIATVAVAPFAAYHFHKSTQFGLLANLVAVPLCNLLVMPAALASLLAMPFGLEAWPLTAMGLGIDGMTWVARRVAELPGAVTLVPAIPGSAFALMVGGGLWLCLWGRSWRLAGLLPIAVGVAIAPWREAPDVIIGGNGGLVAVRGEDGYLAAIDTGRSTFELARWLEHDADPRRPGDVKLGRSIVCDSVGCRATVRGNEVAIARHPAALRDDCDRATLIVWAGRGEASCGIGRRARLVTSGDVGRDGAHVVYFARGETAGGAAADGRGERRRPSAVANGAGGAPEAVMIETVAGWRGRRPWARTDGLIRPGTGP